MKPCHGRNQEKRKVTTVGGGRDQRKVRMLTGLTSTGILKRLQSEDESNIVQMNIHLAKTSNNSV